MLASLLGALAMLASGCNTYYIPPPPVSIFVNSFTSALVISTTDSSGNLVPSTLQLQAAVSNSPDTGIIYSVGQLGNYIEGGSNVLGFVDSSGVYTAPTVVPTPNEVTILAVAHADTTQKATTTLTLLNPTATVQSVTPNVVTAGQSVTLDILGQDFAPGATVNLSGAQVGAVQFVSNSELKMPAQVQSAGLLSLSVVNPDPFGSTNAIAIRSQPSSPASSGAVAVVIGLAGSDSSGHPITATKAYIPEPGSLAVVNLDANKQIASVPLPAGYSASAVAADQAQNEVIVASASSNLVQVVDANHEQVAQTLTAPVVGTTTVDGTVCAICAMVVDSVRHRAILDTASGYFALNLDDGSSTAPLAAAAAATFAYDPATQRIYAPFSNSNGSGMHVIDLVAGTVTTVAPGNGEMFGTGADAATLDPATALVTVGDNSSGIFLSLNFNNAVTAAGATQVPATPFTISAGCAGAWDAMDLDFTSHLGWFANLGGCVGVATMPPGSGSGPPGRPGAIEWARVPAGPDGLPWNNTPLGTPHTIAVYTGPEGRAYGLAVRADSGFLLKMDLALLQTAAPVAGGADSNQVDPTNVTVNTKTVSALTFILLR
ncbi:MAG TPA: IPT/TIG domain-containing protein [Terriglobales bacterium]|nr:IPT/TIG domain-containing protein [Terriglobales bacterium]